MIRVDRHLRSTNSIYMLVLNCFDNGKQLLIMDVVVLFRGCHLSGIVGYRVLLSIMFLQYAGSNCHIRGVSLYAQQFLRVERSQDWTLCNRSLQPFECLLLVLVPFECCFLPNQLVYWFCNAGVFLDKLPVVVYMSQEALDVSDVLRCWPVCN